MNKGRPNIFEYSSYRDFLRDFYNDRKKSQRFFSYRVFVRMCNFSSPNFLKLVIDGKRNLGRRACEKLIEGLKLNKLEREYFNAIVNLEHAKNSEEKNIYLSIISRIRHRAETKTVEVDQYEYFSHWHNVAIRELVALNDFEEDVTWVNKKLGTKMTESRFNQIINSLINLSLLRRNEDGRLVQSDSVVVCTPDIFSVAINNYHREMMERARQSIETSKSKDRDISALTVSINHETFEKIKEKIAHLREEIHQIASISHEKKVVYQVNFQLFNLSEVI